MMTVKLKEHSFIYTIYIPKGDDSDDHHVSLSNPGMKPNEDMFPRSGDSRSVAIIIKKFWPRQK